MKSLKITVFVAMSMVFACAAVAMHHTPEDRGKALFNDTTLGGGTSGKSCATCHADGKGLEGIAGKKEWKTPGGEFKTLEEAVNICVTMALKGTALDVKSEQMKDLVAYLNSIKPKADAGKKKSKAAVGC
jgi:mono/diheme cytochrome c family protein